MISGVKESFTCCYAYLNVVLPTFYWPELPCHQAARTDLSQVNSRSRGFTAYRAPQPTNRTYMGALDGQLDACGALAASPNIA